MNDLKQQWLDFIKYVQNNSYNFYSYIYYVYQFAWIVLNIVLCFSGHSRGLLMKNTHFNYLYLIIADIAINIIFYAIKTYSQSGLFFIVNLMGIVILMFVFPYFNLLHILTTIVLIVIFVKTLYNNITFALYEEYDDEDDYDDYDDNDNEE